jgi:hypothetical protein
MMLRSGRVWTAAAAAVIAVTALGAAPAVGLHDENEGFACSAWATASDSALTYSVGPDQYPVNGWELLPGWSKSGVYSYPCRDDHAALAGQTIPLTGPDGTTVATVSVSAADVESSVPPVRAPGEVGPVVGDGGDAAARPVDVTVRADSVQISVKGVWASASARCTTLGPMPTFSSAGGVGTVTVNGQERSVGTGPIRVGPIGLRFNAVQSWGDEHWGGLGRYALTVDLYPAGSAYTSVSGLPVPVGGGAVVDSYSRTYVGAAGVVRFGNPCSD